MQDEAQVSLEEKRQLLELVRIKYGFETAAPRELGIDKIVEKALAESSAQNPLAAEDIAERLAGRRLPLRLPEVRKAIERLLEAQRVEPVKRDNRTFYCLTRDAAYQIEREIREAAARIGRVVARLYRGSDVDPPKPRATIQTRNNS